MKRGTSRHPKMKALARAFKQPLPFAVGTMQMLWEFAADSHPAGDIGRSPDEDIAEAVAWKKKPAELIQILCQEKWVDAILGHRLLVHDWWEHCEDAVHSRLARDRKYFADGRVPKLTRLSGKERQDAEHYYARQALPERSPCASEAQTSEADALHFGQGMARQGLDVVLESQATNSENPPTREVVSLALIEYPTPTEVLDEVRPIYIQAGAPIPTKHEGLAVQLIIEIPPEKRYRIANYVKWALVSGKWPNPGKTKALLNLLRDGDWDVELAPRTLPDAVDRGQRSGTTRAQHEAEERFLGRRQ